MIAMSEEQVYECLADAGCGKELIKQFEACQHSGIHAEQKKLDLLDYLVWTVKTNGSSAEEGKH